MAAPSSCIGSIRLGLQRRHEWPLVRRRRAAGLIFHPFFTVPPSVVAWRVYSIWTTGAQGAPRPYFKRCAIRRAISVGRRQQCYISETRPPINIHHNTDGFINIKQTLPIYLHNATHLHLSRLTCALHNVLAAPARLQPKDFLQPSLLPTTQPYFYKCIHTVHTTGYHHMNNPLLPIPPTNLSEWSTIYSPNPHPHSMLSFLGWFIPL